MAAWTLAASIWGRSPNLATTDHGAAKHHLGTLPLAHLCQDATPPTGHRGLNHVLPKSLWVTEEMKEEIKKKTWGLPGGPVVKKLPANAGDTGSIPDLGRYHMLWNN